MKNRARKVTVTPPTLGLNSRSRKLLREIDRSQRSREHSAHVTEMNRANSAAVRSHFHDVKASSKGSGRSAPSPVEEPAPDEQELDELIFEEEVLSESLEHSDSNASEDAEQVAEREAHEALEDAKALSCVEETAALESTQLSQSARSKPRRKAAPIPQRPLLMPEISSAALQELVQLSDWRRCEHCKKALPPRLAHRNQALGEHDYHLACIQLAYQYKLDL